MNYKPMLISFLAIPIVVLYVFIDEYPSPFPAEHHPFEPEKGVYLGFWDPLNNSVQFDTNKIRELEAMINKSYAFQILFFNFDELSGESLYSQLTTLDSMKKTTHLVWMPYCNGSENAMILQEILNGRFDDQIDDVAKAIKRFKKPVFIRFGHEMNGFWFIWNGMNNGGGTLNGYGDPKKPDGPERFVDAWRHVHDRFDRIDAENAVWIWSIQDTSWSPLDWNQDENYYPGDDYVDWVGITSFGLYWADNIPNIALKPIYDKYSGKKPIMISESGVADKDHIGWGNPVSLNRLEWLNLYFDALEKDFPRIKAIMYFNEDKRSTDEPDWRLIAEPYPDTLELFKDRVSSDYYLSELEK